MCVSCGLCSSLLCVLIVFIGNLSLNQAASLRCYEKSIDDYQVAKLENGQVLLSTTCYNFNYRNIFYAFGYLDTPDENATQQILKAYLKVPDINLFLLNWEKEASSIEFLGTFGQQLSYVFHALHETVLVGKTFGKTLLKMSKCGLDLDNTELVGHSLGAHVMGNAGRIVKAAGMLVDLITGLDPAGPNFDSAFPRFPTLDHTCAKYVKSIHTDPGGYGMNSSFATLDIYANFGNFINGTPPDQVQPGCPKGVYDMFSKIDLCSHKRSVRYRIAALLNKGSVLASHGTDYYAWAAANGENQHVIDINDDDRSATGNYYFTTNADEPYGRYEDGLSPC